MSISRILQKELLNWFHKHKRDLPWRKKKDPYSIWISEVMLQQTTSKAVIPYYEKFLKKFPTLTHLAKADKKQVFLLWSGLGYYKRAENLIQAAKRIHKQKNFPQTYKELLKLPGFGPYTSRAVSSLAFEESVGVLDGNVIRFLSRFHGLALASWKSKEREQLQRLSSLWVQNQKASQMNQALMEIGALVCISPKALCLLCPLRKNCQGFKKGIQDKLPLRKEKKETEFWLYHAEKYHYKNKWAFTKNTKMPFLKGQWIFPGKTKKLKNPLKDCKLIHNIMNYKIFIHVKNKKSLRNKNQFQWFSQADIQALNPSSLIKKIIDF
ncbi:MAG: A/G-specific adenine glycosylase [Bdellovibrionales bacterium]|nr:A/G-specific adenine glycosylase [Bdellovibrionales bacterium]